MNDIESRLAKVETSATARLGERLIAAGKITEKQLRCALELQRHLDATEERHHRLGELLVRMRYVADADIVEALRGEEHSDAAVAVDIPADIRQRLRIKVLGAKGDTLLVAPMQRLTAAEHAELRQAAAIAGAPVSAVEEVPLDFAEILRSLRDTTVDSGSLARSIAAFNRTYEGVEAIMQAILHDGMQSRASDIHFSYSDDAAECITEYRIDGVKHLVHRFSPPAARKLASRLKTAANLDASNKHQPQDGRLSLDFQGRRIDVRVSTLPRSGNGESIVMRILDPNTLKNLESLLASHPRVLAQLRSLASLERKMPGLVVLSGPTGAGKSTTLYGVLQAMDREGLNIMTAEDPVEQVLPGIDQVQVNAIAGMTYANIVRAFMRQDPDVIVVGEIRDTETAETALRATESGHLLLTTVHASTVAESMLRVLNLLSPVYRPVGSITIASHTAFMMNQRLAGRLCSCAVAGPAGEEGRGLGLDDDAVVMHARGCEKCRGTGYFGRVLVPEAVWLPADETVRAKVFEALQPGQGPDAFLRVAGIEHYSREQAVANLLASRVIDLKQAYTALGHKGGGK